MIFGKQRTTASTPLQQPKRLSIGDVTQMPAHRTEIRMRLTTKGFVIHAVKNRQRRGAAVVHPVGNKLSAIDEIREIGFES